MMEERCIENNLDSYNIIFVEIRANVSGISVFETVPTPRLAG